MVMTEPSVLLVVTDPEVTLEHENGALVLQKCGQEVLRIEADTNANQFLPKSSFTIKTSPRITLDLYINGSHSFLHTSTKPVKQPEHQYPIIP